MADPSPDKLLAEVKNLLRRDEAETALKLVKTALSAQPDRADLQDIAARIYTHQGRKNQAIRALQKAVAIDPDNIDRQQILATTLIDAGKSTAAIAALEDLVRHQPDSPDIWLNLGIAQRQQGNLAAARSAFDKAIDLSPEDWRPLYSKGNCYLDHQDPVAAEDCYRKALALAPQQQSVKYNLAAALADQARPEDALAILGPAAHNDAADSKINRSLLLLQSGKLLKGLDLYQSRFDLPGRNLRHQEISSLKDAPDDLNGKTVLLWGEQGFGDSLQFIRFARRLKDRNARILFDCRAPLHPLLKLQTALTDDIWQPGMTAEYQFPVMSLPLLLCRDDQDLAPAGPYLALEKPDQNSEENRKVAISWAGFAGHQNDHNRSLSTDQAECLLVLLNQAGFRPVSIQMDAAAQHKTWLDEGLLSDAPGDDLSSFLDTAQVLSGCAGLISVDTAAIHLAGALGIPGIVMLPYNPDWRWGLDEGITPWYDSIYRLRQHQIGDWNGLLNRIPETALQLFG